MGDFDEWVAKYMAYVDQAIAMVPYKRMGIFKEFFFNPAETIKKENVSIMQRLKDLYAMTILSVLIAALSFLPMMLIQTLFNPLGGIFFIAILGAELVAILIFGPILGFLYSLLELLVAKLLGGAGDMQANFNASSLPGLSIIVVLLPITIASVPLAWLSAIPLVSLCTLCITLPLSVITGIVWLYSFYLRYVAFRETHKLSPIRAAAVVVLPMAFVFMMLIVIAILAYAALIAWLMGVYSAGLAASSIPG